MRRCTEGIGIQSVTDERAARADQIQWVEGVEASECVSRSTDTGAEQRAVTAAEEFGAALGGLAEEVVRLARGLRCPGVEPGKGAQACEAGGERRTDDRPARDTPSRWVLVAACFGFAARSAGGT